MTDATSPMIHLNDTVAFTSLNNPARTFRGRVRMVYIDRAIVETASEPRLTVIPTYRLVKVHTMPPRFAGRAA